MICFSFFILFIFFFRESVVRPLEIVNSLFCRLIIISYSIYVIRLYIGTLVCVRACARVHAYVFACVCVRV